VPDGGDGPPVSPESGGECGLSDAILFEEVLRLEPKPRFLKREFIKSINPKTRGRGVVQVGQPFFKTREALDDSGLVEACKRNGLGQGLCAAEHKLPRWRCLSPPCPPESLVASDSDSNSDSDSSKSSDTRWAVSKGPSTVQWRRSRLLLRLISVGPEPGLSGTQRPGADRLIDLLLRPPAQEGRVPGKCVTGEKIIWPHWGRLGIRCKSLDSALRVGWSVQPCFDLQAVGQKFKESLVSPPRIWGLVGRRRQCPAVLLGLIVKLPCARPRSSRARCSNWRSRGNPSAMRTGTALRKERRSTPRDWTHRNW
jgi:hypothetical protein